MNKKRLIESVGKTIKIPKEKIKVRRPYSKPTSIQQSKRTYNRKKSWKKSTCEEY